MKKNVKAIIQTMFKRHKPIFKNHRFEKLLYNQAAKMVVVQLRSPSKLYIARLYARYINEKKYHKIKCDSKSNISYESIISSIKFPKIYFNVETRKLINKTTVVGNWVEVLSYDLKTQKVSSIIDEKILKQITGAKRVWVSALLSFTVDEQGLICKIGFEQGKNFNGGYYLCKLILKPLHVRKIAFLKDTFY